jgi:hypothetical protein
MPVATAAGRRPAQAAMRVIITGRIAAAHAEFDRDITLLNFAIDKPLPLRRGHSA